jgi:hypothetical protein
MLTNDIEAVDLVTERLKLQELIPAEVQEYFYNDKMIVRDALSRFAISYTKVKV